MVFPKRLATFRDILEQKRVDIAIVSKLANVRYLTGFTGTSGTAVISRRKAFFLTDFRYQTQAEQEISGFQIEVYRKSFNQYLASLLKRLKNERIGFESNFVSNAQFEKWASHINTTWVALDNAVENLRITKDRKEIAKIRKAADIADKAFAHVLPIISPSVTERELAIELEYSMRKLGAEGFAFESIVAGGKRSALPHAASTAKRVKKNAFLVLDFGAVYQGYCSDMTRTVFVGNPSKKDLLIYNEVLESQKRALQKIVCGIPASQVDGTARNYLAQHDLSKYFGHNLGHGVGLEIHEAPTIGASSRDILRAGMVFTIEPGVYIKEMGGVRIEDLLVLEEHGIQILTNSSKELIAI
jgi:Xaa-Pro aminopeptidase